MTQLAIATAPRRNSRHWTQTTVQWEDVLEWATTPANTKESGNYLLGTLQENTTVTHPGSPERCTNTHRRKDFVVSRSGITLDVDYPQADFAARVEMLFTHKALLHTTYNSTPTEPRYRLIIPTDREMAPDEYVAAAKTLMSQLGESQFDPGTHQPERYMFRPAAADPTAYTYLVLDGPLLVVDELLVGFEEDLSDKEMPRPHRNKRDPFALEGVIGAFNRAYRDWDLLIEVYELPYVKVAPERYQLAGTRAAAGMGPIPDTEGLVYSHHSNDPAGERACSAFDLVRLHHFGDLDEDTPAGTPVNKLPSHRAMADLAAGDHRVVAELVGADFDAELDATEAEDWRLRLRFSGQTGRLIDDIANWDLIVANDPLFAGLSYNERNMAVEFTTAPAWRKLDPPMLTETDRNHFTFALERSYRLRPPRYLVDSLIDTKAAENTVDPVRDYIESLVWDGKRRLETCLPGVEDTPYTRLVARKVMVAAVARALDPGCKWDHTLVLYGPEGIGKTWWIERVSRGYSSTLGRINNKDTLLAMQQSWIVVSDEGHALKHSSESNAMKEFLTRRQDLYRAPYDREVKPHPRGCVIWATTNDEAFLRRQEGNRRFLIVHCRDRVDFDAVTDDYVDQLWAEAAVLYRSGEPLFFNELESVDAAAEREPFMEEDVLFGQVVEFLDTPVPDDWDELTPAQRKTWLYDFQQGFLSPGSGRIDYVCSAQVWVEALDRRRGEARRDELAEITDALKRIPGWYKMPGRHRMCGYGPQVTFARQTDSI